jgi:hypothetical protein
MNRRSFLWRTAATAAAPFFHFNLSPLSLNAMTQPGTPSDEEICKSKFDFAISQKLSNRPINEVVVEVGKTFLGTEYVGHVLEEEGAEHLVVNMRALDCVSFYENCLTLARCIKMKKYTFNDYKKQLQFIRYRGGVIKGYQSRLHYTTDYFFDNQKKGVLKVVTKQLFGEKNVHRVPRPINFMTTHKESYKQLANPKVFAAIQQMEKQVNKRVDWFMPKGNLHMFEDKIPTGSIIGITTNTSGMDIAHTGVAIRMEDGKLHFMHAPLSGAKVQITENTLHEYLASHGKQTGIIVALPLEPKAIKRKKS